MTPKEAQEAIIQSPEENICNIGFWSHIHGEFENSSVGTVLHFWPTENAKKIKIIFPDKKWLHTAKRITSCKMSDDLRVIPHMSDLYMLRKLPKCKKCLRNLTLIAADREESAAE